MQDLPSALRALAAQMVQVADELDRKAVPSEALKVPEVARQLGLSRSTVQRWARLGRIGRKVGRDYLIAPHEVAAWRAELKAQRSAGEE